MWSRFAWILPLPLAFLASGSFKNTSPGVALSNEQAPLSIAPSSIAHLPPSLDATIPVKSAPEQAASQAKANTKSAELIARAKALRSPEAKEAGPHPPDRFGDLPFDFNNSPLSKHELEPYLKGRSAPARIDLYTENGVESMERNPGQIIKEESDRFLIFSTGDYGKKTARRRSDEAFDRSPAWTGSQNATAAQLYRTPIHEDAYILVSFLPGRTESGEAFRQNKDINFAVTGPDLDLSENPKPNEIEKIEAIRARVLSLGHGGEVTLEVSDGGYIVDEAGPDFYVFENVMRLQSNPSVYFNEFAAVGVSEVNEAQSYKWFPCNPAQKILKSCAGIVPTREGGDAFDLGELGLTKVRYIKIRDTNTNFHPYNKAAQFTEGFDLDAIRIKNGYR